MTTSTAIINYINTGTGVNSGDGDSLRTAFNKINLNFKNVLNSFVAAGVASFNSQTGLVTFTGTDIINQLGYIPYPDSNPLGFITSSTANLQNYASITYVNDNFVSELDLSGYNFASVNYVDAKLTEYPTLTYLNNQGFLVPATLPDFLTAYSTQTDLANLTVSMQNFTTSSIFEAVKNSSIIPAVADSYDLGEESYRWGTLYLSNAAYIKGIGITIDPINSRLIVDGNSVTGAFRFSPTSIYNEAGIGFSISSTAPDPLAAQQKVRIYVPTDSDAETIPLDVTNTGTMGILLQGYNNSLTIDQNGFNFVGNLNSSLILNETTNQFLKIGKNPDIFVASTGTFTTYSNTAEISAYSTNSNSQLVLSGSRVVLHASTSSTWSQYTPTGYLGLDESYLYLGKTKTKGYGSPSDPNTFTGFRLPLNKPSVGQILAVTGTSGDVATVTFSTVSVPNLKSPPPTLTSAGVYGDVAFDADYFYAVTATNSWKRLGWNQGGTNLLSVSSHILPDSNLTYDLGSTSSQWRSLYVGTSTIYLGGTALSIAGGQLTIGGSPVQGGGVATTSTLVNGTYTVSLSNTALTQFPSYSGGSLFIQGPEIGSVNSSIAVSAANDIILTSNIIGSPKQWTFGTGSNITLPGGGNIIGADYSIAIVGGNDGSSAYGDVNITTNNPFSTSTWSFGTMGELTLPSGGEITSNQITNEIFGTTTTSLTLVPGGATEAGQRLEIYATIGGEGNHLHLTAGESPTELYLGNDSQYVKLGSTGEIIVSAQNGLTLWGEGVMSNAYLILPNNIDSSSTSVTIGNVNGDVLIQASEPGNPVPNNWFFGRDGGLTFPDGTTQTTAAVGGGGGGIENTSTLVSGAYTVALSTSGSLILPGIEDNSTPAIDFFSGAPTNHIVTLTSDWTLKLKSRANGANEGHLWLEAGQNTAIKVHGNGSNVEIVASTGTNAAVWNFTSDGTLTFPSGGDITFDNSATSYIYGITGIEFADGTTQTTAVVGGGGGGVSSITAGTGTFVSTSTGAVTVWVGNTSNLEETFESKTSATGVVVHDCSTNRLFYHTGMTASFTANFTNLNLASGEATSISLVLVQGGTARMCTAVQIAGAAQTILWQGSASAPSGNASRTEVVTFSVLCTATNAYSVLGMLTSFGGA